MTSSDLSPILLWFRRDLRTSDHPALHAAAASGRPVIPVFLRDEGVDGIGAAPRMRVGLSVAALRGDLKRIGSRLILRSGPAAEALAVLATEIGARAVWWTRLHDPLSRLRDEKVRTALSLLGVETKEFEGHLLHEPATFLSGSGKPYQAYAPFARALRRADPGPALPAPSRLSPPLLWPPSESLEAWRLDAAMNRGASVVAVWQAPGEARALERLHVFAAERLSEYKVARDFPGRDASSKLSDALSLGEIGPRTCWTLAREALGRAPEGAEQFLREIAWRDFSHHLLWHSPQMDREHWRPAWKEVGWSQDERSPLVLSWRQGRTGFAIVDAAMREMWVTGRMHNRARMIVASLLTKHMMTDWRVGLRVFEDCLTDWDPANNAVNWQWVAGSGPDAAPFFRIYNPQSQSETWDADQAYVRRWIAEGQANPTPEALSFFEAVPRAWGLDPRDPYPDPVLDLAQSRNVALSAFRTRFKGQGAASA